AVDRAAGGASRSHRAAAQPADPDGAAARVPRAGAAHPGQLRYADAARARPGAAPVTIDEVRWSPALEAFHPQGRAGHRRHNGLEGLISPQCATFPMRRADHMERRRLISWLTATAAVAVGLLLYGVVFGGISPPAEPALTPDGQAAPVLRHGAAASLPRLGSMKGRGTDDGAANFEDPAASFEDPAANFEDPADRTPREDATDASAAGPAAAGDLTAPSTLHITEESAFHRSVIDFSSLLLPMREGRLGGLNLPGQIDYRDLAEQGRVPLIEVRGRREAPLSKHFRVGDFAAKDGAPYARIAPELVELLDDLTEHFGTRVHINSAYRHPGLNFSARIDGAADSRHMAGLAADIWVEGHSPFEVAETLVNIRGCRIGLGLGEHYLHVDLRDWAASWTYPGAALPEADFDLWMIEQCEEFIAESVRQ